MSGIQGLVEQIDYFAMLQAAFDVYNYLAANSPTSFDYTDLDAAVENMWNKYQAFQVVKNQISR